MFMEPVVTFTTHEKSLQGLHGNKGDTLMQQYHGAALDSSSKSVARKYFSTTMLHSGSME